MLEGGAFYVDGQGTLVTTESCLLHPNRNPHLSRAEIEAELRRMLGVEKIIWLPGNPDEVETNGHVDGIASFIAPGRMLCQTALPEQGDYFHVMRENRRALELATDAAGRRFELLDLPSPIVTERFGSERYCDCYANYILVNGAVIVSAFGVEQDQAAREVFSRAFPNRNVEMLPIPTLSIGGGSIHCSTQQQRASRTERRFVSGFRFDRAIAMPSKHITVAAVQMASGSWNLEDNMATAERLIRAAAARRESRAVPGAVRDAVLLPRPERAPSRTRAAVRRQRADRPFRGAGRRFRHRAADRLLRACGQCRVQLDRRGRRGRARARRHRKTHIPDGPGYTEKFYFTPGDTGFKVWDTRFGRIGIGICWDQWYPETARSLALMGAEILCFPTIIGSEPFSSAFDSSGHWQRTDAAANMVPVVAANRIGREVGFGNGNPAQRNHGRVLRVEFHRGSHRRSGPRRTAPMKPCSCTFDLDAIRADRQSWGFFRDRRPEMYRTLLTSDGVSSCYR